MMPMARRRRRRETEAFEKTLAFGLSEKPTLFVLPYA